MFHPQSPLQLHQAATLQTRRPTRQVIRSQPWLLLMGTIILLLGLEMCIRDSDWFELIYHDVPEARSNVARCDADGTGALAFSMAGFTSSALTAFDVTTATQPVRLVNAVVTGSAAPYTLQFTDTRAIPHSRCLSLADSAFLTPVSITLDAPSDVYKRQVDGCAFARLVRYGASELQQRRANAKFIQRAGRHG